MEYYNAFISYNHNERDEKIAAHIQEKLEHYVLPAPAADRTGMECIPYVFRDKGDLAASGDLDDEIRHALYLSDYLIVICSEQSRAARWVEKEIRYFLTCHKKNRVLTVLSQGEPEQVIPALLRDGGEPLSADYRFDLRRADREELPRLAAAIAGCRYDDLVQRRLRGRGFRRR